MEVITICLIYGENRILSIMASYAQTRINEKVQRESNELHEMSLQLSNLLRKDLGDHLSEETKNFMKKMDEKAAAFKVNNKSPVEVMLEAPRKKFAEFLNGYSTISISPGISVSTTVLS